MKIHALFVASVFVGGLKAECTPPTAAVNKLEAYFKYQNSLGSNLERLERFTALTTGDYVFFRHDNPPSDYEPGSRPVYVYQPTKGIDVANCPAGNEWVKCVGDYLRQEESSSGLKPDSTGACEFTLNVPRWHPSPDSPLKRRLATDILHEAMEFGGFSNPQAVYLRDFNVGDPDILIYVVTQRGGDRFLGCSFDTAASQHCSWHRFGQTPLPALREQIMGMPYQIYPSR